jgi:membrane-associated phospholipid phosphatase
VYPIFCLAASGVWGGPPSSHGLAFDPKTLWIDGLKVCITFYVPPLTTPPLAFVNPFGQIDHGAATWFHAHLTHKFVAVLRAITEFGSSEWIAVVLSIAVLLFIFKRWWLPLATLVVAVPGGMLLNELVKILVHRHRPFVDGWFVDWSGYSFASGHTIGATLLYGQIALFVFPLIKGRRGRVLLFSAAMFVVALVGFSRIALGAHYVSDVLAGMFFGMAWLTICLFAARPLRRIAFRPVVEGALPEGSPDLVPVPVPVQSDTVVAPPPNSLV